MERYSEVNPNSPRLIWPPSPSAVSSPRVGTESSLSPVFAAPT